MAVRWCPGLLWGHMASSESYRQELWHPSPYVQCLRLSTSLAQELSTLTCFWTSSPCLTVKASHCQRLYTFLSRSLFSELWVADLLPASCSRPLILSLLCSSCHFGVVFIQPPLSIWWHEVFGAIQTAWMLAQYRWDIWALLAAKTMLSLPGPWYWGHISKDWWAT